MSQRIEKLLTQMELLNIDAVIVSNPYNRRYLSGFTGSSGYLVISKEKRIMLTDFRYIEQATKQCQGFEIVDFFKKGLMDTLAESLVDCKAIRIGFENATLTYKEFTHFEATLKGFEWVPLHDVIEKIRMIKDEQEIKTVALASSIGDAAFSHILTVIRQGMTEIDVAIELEFFMKKQGASKLSFDTIVASGTRSSLPHAVPTNKVIESGDFVTLDFGCIFEGYCSDMTRTIVVGKASERQKEIYELVLKAQQTALEMIQPGIVGKVGDSYARSIINNAGYAQYFGHGLGHSLGLEVHEQPRFSQLSDEIILPGMIMSVEPGIYIPDFGGVRIEDLILIETSGIRNFVTSPKELIEV